MVFDRGQIASKARPVTWFDNGPVERRLTRLARWGGGGARNGAESSSPVVRAARFEELALPHARALFRTAYHLSGNAAEAEDLTQEAYLRAFRAFDDYRGGEFRAWLLAILRNAFLDECRRRGRRVMVELEVADLPSGPGNGAASAWAPSAESEALRHLPGEAIERAFAALPPDWKLVVLLADVEDLTYREIAEVTCVPIGTVMSRLHRARKRMQEQILNNARAVPNQREKSA